MADKQEEPNVEIVETPAPDGTSKPQIEAQPDDSGEVVEVEITPAGNSQEEETPPSDEKHSNDDIKAMSGKISSLERERNEAKQAAELRQKQMESHLKSLDTVFRNDPVAYEKWRQEWVADGNPDFGSHEEVYKRSAQPVQGAQPQQGVDTSGINNPNNAALTQEAVRHMVRAEQEEQKGFEQFIQAVPEMNPENFKDDPERLSKASETYKKMLVLRDSFRMVNPGMGVGDALVAAWNSLPENSGKQVELAQKAGELAGYAKAYADGTGTVGSVGGANTNKTGATKVKMTPEQKARYEQLLAKNKSVAEKFAQSIANQNG